MCFLVVEDVVRMAKAVSELRKMQRNQLTRLTKDELIDGILAEPERSNEVAQGLTVQLTALTNEITELKRLVSSPDSVVNQKFAVLQSQIDKEAEVIARQQQFLEVLDLKERETNLIVTGVPDEHKSLEGETTEEGKPNKIWMKMNVREKIVTHRWLGRRNEGSAGNNRWCILVTLGNKVSREKTLEKTKLLKEVGGDFSTIYIKKDLHPSVRKEWKRLHDAEKRENETPENVGCNIHFNTRERKLFREGVTIDSWNPYFF